MKPGIFFTFICSVLANPLFAQNMPFSRSDNAIQCPGAPKANGNYALVIKHGNVLHLSGWMGQYPETGKVVEGGAVAQTVSTAGPRNVACIEFILPIVL